MAPLPGIIIGRSTLEMPPTHLWPLLALCWAPALAHGYVVTGPVAVPSLPQHARCRHREPTCVRKDVDAACLVDERCIHFVTGNKKKELEVNTILGAQQLEPFRVTHVDIDLPELQGDPTDIAREKCKEAARRVGGPVLVEDTSLCFTALNGLPGPYIKWFVDRLGNEGLYRLLDPYADKSAFCQCVLGFSPGPGAEPSLFIGRTDGTIVEPCGNFGFGWDAIFVPEGKDAPFGAMTLDEKNQLSHRARALEQFVQYVKAEEATILQQMALQGEQGGG